YRSDSAGELFQKIQGIPYSARRTRSLHMDPVDHNVVYAGTTEGLWKTADAGATWKRMTGASVVVNDVVIDPRQPTRVLLATDRSGVLASNDGGATFAASNRGFAHRQVAALLVDRSDSSVVFAGVLNDKEFGGAFVSHDSGRTWSQVNEGLDGRDVLALREAADHSIVAGTDRGIFLLLPNSQRWQPINNLVPVVDADPQVSPKKEEKLPALPVKMSQRPRRGGVGELSARVTGLAIAPERWFATTAAGLMVSADSGASWRQLDLPGMTAVIAVAQSGKMLVAAGRTAVAVSVNGGESWLPTKPLYADFTVNAVAVESSGDIWLATREGVFRSTDLGDSWRRISSLRIADVASIQFDELNQQILATSSASNSSSVFESLDNGRTWTQINSGWPLRGVSPAQGRLLGVTPFDGVVLQPETTAAGSAYLPAR
ncbi:MAG TPA: transcriptional regulator, partial [Terriglobales bacterium]